MERRILSSILLAVAGLGLAPAHAATVEVTLRLTGLEPVIEQAEYKSCAVSVAEGADGVAVLDAAEDSGCIESYETSEFDFGRFVECIDGICSTPATYWRMTENGELTSYGVDGFAADAGDVLGFSYTTWVGCLADASLC